MGLDTSMHKSIAESIVPTDIKLILTDIDGTILPYGCHEVSERTIAAFRAAQDKGICVGPASGRARKWIAPMLRGHEELCATALATNGMEVWLDGELLHREILDREKLVTLGEYLGRIPHAGLVCFDEGTPYLVVGSLEDLTLCFPSYAQTCHVVDELPSFPIVKCNAFITADLAGTQEFVSELNATFLQLTFDVPQAAWSNVTSRGWTKASGIDVLCERLGIGLNQVVVFGDGGNDVAMLEHVPTSVAVEKAAPDAAAAARWHIGRCEDDAVAAAVEALVAGEWPFVN